MKMKPLGLALITIGVIFGSVLLTSLTGYWTTESTKEPSKFTTGDFAGQADPADIRGSYTFADIEKAFGIDAEVLARAFGVDEANAGAFALKSLESIYASLEAEGTEIGTGSVRYFVALYKGLPYESEEKVYLPVPAVEILIQEGKVSGAAADALKALAVEIPSTSGDVTATEKTSTGALTINGKTTFGEVLDAWVSKVDIESVIGAPMPNPLTVIKTYCTEQGLDYETVKSRLQELIEAP